MSNLAEHLLLHLKLDALTNEQVVDGVLLVPDDRFGACVSCDGRDGLIDAPTLTDARALAFWVNVAPDQADGAYLLDAQPGLTDGWVTPTDAGAAWETIYVNGQKVDTLTAAPLPAGRWTHLYLVAKANFTGGLRLMAKATKGGYTQGKVAHLRVYDQAITAADLVQLQRAGQLPGLAFTAAHPLAFRLYDAAYSAVLYIDDDPSMDHQLTLEVQNQAGRAIQLADPHAPADRVADVDTHHFALHFRPNTLAQRTLDLLQNQGEQGKAQVLGSDSAWDIYVTPETHATTDIVVLYLLYKGDQSTLAKGATLRLTLHNFCAAPADGARNTLVELCPHQLCYVGESAPIIGSRLQRLHIANHSGRATVPFHLGVLGGNRILNDGHATSTLTLHLTNSNKCQDAPLGNGAITLRGKGDNGGAASMLFLAFKVYDGSGDTVGCLCEQDELPGNLIEPTGICVRRAAGGDPEQDRFTVEELSAGLGQARLWCVTPNADLCLQPNDTIEITLTGLKSSLPTGSADLYLHYEDIPGYWDGQLVCTVEKTPLIFHEDKVGIGTTAPTAALHIMPPVRRDTTAAEPSLQVEGATKLDGALIMAGDIALNDQLLKLRKSDDGNHGICFSKAVNGTELRGLRGFVWKTGENGATERMRMDKNGKVGIGTTTPQTALDVTGTVSATQFVGNGAVPKGVIVMWHGQPDQTPAGWVLCDGNNGTPDLRDRFIVGAGKSYKVNDKGGLATVKLETANLPLHTHAGSTSSSGEHQHWIEGTDARGLKYRKRNISGQTTVDMGFGGGSDADPNEEIWRGAVNTDTQAAHQHTFTTAAAGGNQSHENRPPYYALCFIMKM